MSDPCATCPDTACESGFGCPEAPLMPCAASCDYAGDCLDGDLCAMLRPDLARLDLDCGEARELAEAWASI